MSPAAYVTGLSLLKPSCLATPLLSSGLCRTPFSENLASGQRSWSLLSRRSFDASTRPIPVVDQSPSRFSVHAATRTESRTLERTNADKIRNLGEWLRIKGGAAEVDVREDGAQLRLFTKNDVAAGEELIAVPGSLFISADRYEGSPFGLLFDEYTEQVALALLLLHEKSRGPQSQWAAYIDALPTETEGALGWTDDDFALLEASGSAAYRDAVEICELTDGYYDDVSSGISFVLPGLLPKGFLTPQNFRWAMSMVHSRALGLRGWEGLHPDGTQRFDLSFIPYADLARHCLDDQATASWYLGDISTSTGGQDPVGFCVTNEKDLPAGTKIQWSFGPIPNLRLLTYSNTALPNNPNDAFDISLTVDDDDPLRDAKLKYLLMSGYSHPFGCFISRRDLPNVPERLPKLLAILDAKSVDELTEEQLRRKAAYDTDEALLKYCNERLARYRSIDDLQISDKCKINVEALRICSDGEVSALTDLCNYLRAQL